ncbi:MAG TPA: hypothetical protein PLD25_04525 [Chloroflexota bacterium]|nr:hypothetical protein [Chloroflexota bacterium]
MSKEYDYAQGARAVWFVLTPAIFLFWLFFLWLAWVDPGLPTRRFLLFISLLTWPLLLWGVLFLVLSTMRVQMQETVVTLHFHSHTRTIPYEDITAVRQNRLFIIIHTRHGRILIERSIQRSSQLVAELNRRAPALRRAAVRYITAPLPRHLTAKLSSFLSYLFLIGLCLFFSLGMIAALQVSDNTLEKLLALTVSATSIVLGLLLLYNTLFDLPRRVTFLYQHIMVVHVLRRQRFDAGTLQDANVKRQMITYKGVTRPSDTLILTFTDGRSLTLQQDHMQQSFLEFLPVLEHHYRIKPRHHREKRPVPFPRFGVGSQNEFRWYFERDSRVQPANVAEICHWLQQCRYVSDHEQFNTRDH